MNHTTFLLWLRDRNTGLVLNLTVCILMQNAISNQMSSTSVGGPWTVIPDFFGDILKFLNIYN